MRRYFALFLLLPLAGCGRPEIQIDSQSVQSAQGRSPIGLVEVHRAQSGNGFGLAIGETLNESRFCTGSLLADGRVLTSSDCLGNQYGRFEAKDLEFHYRPGNDVPTAHYAVRSADGDGGRAGLLYLTLNGGPSPTQSRGGLLSLATGTLRVSTAQPTLPAVTLTVGSPNKDGLALSAVAQSDVEYNADGFAFPTLPPDPAPGNGVRPVSNPNNGVYGPGYGSGYGNGYGSPYGSAYGPNYGVNQPGPYGNGALGPSPAMNGGTNFGTAYPAEPGYGTAYPGYGGAYGYGSPYPANNNATNANDASTETRYSTVKAVGLGDPTWGSPVLVDGAIAGVVHSGPNGKGTEVYWLDDRANPQASPPSRSDDRDSAGGGGTNNGATNGTGTTPADPANPGLPGGPGGPGTPSLPNESANPAAPHGPGGLGGGFGAGGFPR